MTRPTTDPNAVGSAVGDAQGQYVIAYLRPTVATIGDLPSGTSLELAAAGYPDGHRLVVIADTTQHAQGTVHELNAGTWLSTTEGPLMWQRVGSKPATQPVLAVSVDVTAIDAAIAAKASTAALEAEKARIDTLEADKVVADDIATAVTGLATSASVTAVADDLAIYEGLAEAAIANNVQRLTELEGAQPDYIVRTGESAILASDIGSLVVINGPVSLPQATADGSLQRIDIRSASAGSILLGAPTDGAISGDVTIPPLRAATAVLVTNNTWDIIGTEVAL